MAIDKETLELLERRLSETVEARVRGRLFKFYFSIAGVLLAVLGFIGFNVVDWLETKANTAADAAVNRAVDKVITPAIADAETATEVTRQKTADMLARFQVLDELQIDRFKQLNQSSDELNQARALLSAFSEEIEARIASIKGDIEDTEAQVKAQGERLTGKEVAGIDYVENVEKNLARLAEQVAILEEQLSEVREKAPSGVVYSAQTADPRQIAKITQVSPTVSNTISLAGETVVYFQFAGVKRELVESISRDLEGDGFEMPGEERTGNAAGLHEVRFFHAGDADRAARLQEAVNRALAARDLKPNVEVRDATTYKGAKTRPGTIELWLEPVPDV